MKQIIICRKGSVTPTIVTEVKNALANEIPVVFGHNWIKTTTVLKNTKAFQEKLVKKLGNSKSEKVNNVGEYPFFFQHKNTATTIAPAY